MSTLRPQDAVLDSNKTLGSKYVATTARPIHEFVNGVRSEKVTGHSYEIVLLERKFQSLTVRIEGEQQLFLSDNEPAPEVRLEGIELFLYWRSGAIELGCRASKIVAVNTPKT